MSRKSGKSVQNLPKTEAETVKQKITKIPLRNRDDTDNPLLRAVKILERKFGTITALCEVLDIKSAYLYKCISDQNPSLKMSMQIVKLLDGEMTLEDLRPDLAQEIDDVLLRA